MTGWRTDRQLGRTAQKWCALAERRRAAYVALYASGHWKTLYTEERFMALMREAIASAETWARIAPLPAVESSAHGPLPGRFAAVLPLLGGGEEEVRSAHSMDTFVFAAVLFAAACHAGWNAAIKRGLDPLATTVLISLGASVVALALAPFSGLPAAPAWPWVIASIVIHLVYFAALIESYRAGDMGQVYPLARGSAPLMTAALSPLVVNEAVGAIAFIGIAVLAGGVFLLSLRGGRELARINRRAVGFALLTAVTICAYSLVDGIGARRAGSANAYTVALFAGIGPVMLAYALVRGGAGVIAVMGRHWATGLAGGALQLGSYGIAIWAMTVAPIALVAALRETSVLFGAVIAVVFLKEPLRQPRIVAAVMIVCGLVLIRLN